MNNTKTIEGLTPQFQRGTKITTCSMNMITILAKKQRTSNNRGRW